MRRNGREAASQPALGADLSPLYAERCETKEACSTNETKRTQRSRYIAYTGMVLETQSGRRVCGGDIRALYGLKHNDTAAFHFGITFGARMGSETVWDMK